MAIIGRTWNGYTGTVTIQVTGFDTDRIAHLINKFAKNCIETGCAETGKDLIIFEYNLRGDLRNPQKLLKSLRSKLIRASNTARAEFMQEMSDLDHQIDNAFHGRMKIG